MNRDLLVSGWVTRSGHSDGNRTSGAVGQPTHFRRRDPDGSGGPWPLLRVLHLPSLPSAPEQEWKWPWFPIHFKVLGPSQPGPSGPLQLLPAVLISRAKGESNGFLITWAVPQPPQGLGQLWYVCRCPYWWPCLHTQCTCSRTGTHRKVSLGWPCDCRRL